MAGTSPTPLLIAASFGAGCIAGGGCSPSAPGSLWPCGFSWPRSGCSDPTYVLPVFLRIGGGMTTAPGRSSWAGVGVFWACDEVLLCAGGFLCDVALVGEDGSAGDGALGCGTAPALALSARARIPRRIGWRDMTHLLSWPDRQLVARGPHVR